LAAPAFAQDAPDITLTLSPAQVAEIWRLVDLQPCCQVVPPAFFDLQAKLGDALDANPAALRAFLAARSAAR
jgi:hypothetical protein